MNQLLVQVTLLVRDYDEALRFYVDRLRFELLEDTPLNPAKRWVLVKPPGIGSCRLLLAKATTPEQRSAVGNQSGGRVFLFLQTDDFWRDYHRMKQNGIVFTEDPRHEAYGTVVVFRDVYGNLWDLWESKQPRTD